MGWPSNELCSTKTSDRQRRGARDTAHEVVIISDEVELAQLLHRAATRRGLRVLAAIGLGLDGSAPWADLASMTVGPTKKRSIGAAVLVGLSRPVDPAVVAAGDDHVRAKTTLLLLDRATHWSCPQKIAANVPSTTRARELAAACGWDAFLSLEQALQATRLKTQVRAIHGRTLALADTSTKASLLAQTLHLSGIPTCGDPPSRSGTPWTARHHEQATAWLAAATHCRQLISRGDHRVDAIICDIEAAELDCSASPFTLFYPSSMSPEKPWAAGEETLRALGRLLRRNSTRLPACSVPPWSKRALGLVQGRDGDIGEMRAKELLRAMGIRTPEERLVTSPSAAAQAAGQLRGAFAVKVVGQGSLRPRRRWGGIQCNVSGPTKVRQACRDVVFAFRRYATTFKQSRAPQPEGVLISPMQPNTHTLDITVLRLSRQTMVLWTQALENGVQLHDPIAALCPLTEASANDIAQDLVRRMDLTSTQRTKRTAQVGHLLTTLAAGASCLTDHLLLLRADAICFPQDAPPTAVDAQAVVSQEGNL